jgi:integration host factor subunit beta
LTRSELNAEIAAAHPHLRDADVETIVATIFIGITSALAHGHRVELRGFGAFTVRQREAHLARNPRTGESVSVDRKSTSFFRTGTDPLRRVNAGKLPQGRRRPNANRRAPR